MAENYTDEDYLRLHRAHCHTGDKLTAAETTIAELRAANIRLRDALEPLWQRAQAPGADVVPSDGTVTVFMKDCREAAAAVRIAGATHALTLNDARDEEGPDGPARDYGWPDAS